MTSPGAADGPPEETGVPPLIAEREYRRLSPLTPVVRAPIVVLAFVGGSWQTLIQDGDVSTTAYVLLALLGAGTLYGLFSWIRTKYWIDDDELRVDKGVIARQSRRIRIDRLQGIDIVQPFLARVFGLAELRFDVASGSDREGSLAFLPHGEALALRTTLLHRRDDLRDTEPDSRTQGQARDRSPGLAPGAAPTAGEGRNAAADPAQPEQELARLDLGLLVVSLVLSPEAVVTVLSGGALLVGFALTGTFFLAGALIPTAIGFGIALFRKLTSFYGFRLAESDAGLHVTRGLTSLSSQTIALSRVQGLVITEPLMWRPFGWAKLEVSVAGYGSSDVDKAQPSSTLMPVAPRDQCVALLDHVLRQHGVVGSTLSSVALSAPPRRARWLAPLSFWWLAFGRDDRLVVSRRGVVARRLDVVPLARVQSVQLTQGPVRRLLGLADLHVDSPPGPVVVRGDLRDAVEARDRAEATVLAGRAARRALLRDRGSPGSRASNDPLL